MLRSILSVSSSRDFLACRHFCYKVVGRDPRPARTEIKPRSPLPPSDKSKSKLSNYLRSKIKATGPITLAEYMRIVLTSPQAGYYMNKDMFGHKGDYITSPEINQIFCELIAIWCINEWKKIGAVTPFQLVELGPGRGTLMHDVLRVFAKLGVSSKDFTVHFIEISPFLSQVQARRICYQYSDTKPDRLNTHYRYGETLTGVPVYWYRNLSDLPKQFSIVLAHEFLDALPIHKFELAMDNKWHEVLVDNLPSSEDKFRFILSNAETPGSKLFSEKFSVLERKKSVEFSFDLIEVIDEISRRLEGFGGCSLFIDYGHLGTRSDTFRAFRNHKLHDPLVEPGSADLTADIDFLFLKKYIEQQGRAFVQGPVDQREFLTNMGGELRMEQLLSTATNDIRDKIKSSYDMLTNPAKMGKRFKFMCMYPQVLKTHLSKFPSAGF